MKKLLPYIILILIVIVELFGSIFNVQAQWDPTNPTYNLNYGVCFYTQNDFINYTNGVITGIYGSNAPRRECPSPYVWKSFNELHNLSSPSTTGYCVVAATNMVYPSSTTRRYCEDTLGGRWTAGPMPTGDLVPCTKNGVTKMVNRTICRLLGGTVRNSPPPPPPPPPNGCPNGATNPPTCTIFTPPPPPPPPPTCTRAQVLQNGVCVPGVCRTGTTGTYPDCVSVQNAQGIYHLLEPLPVRNCTEGDTGCTCTEGVNKVCTLTDINISGTGRLGFYLNLMITLFIGLCAVAAVVMIVIGGIEYSTSELISSKEAAKERIRAAILGLLLALCSYLILYTINPDLLNTDVDIGGATLNTTAVEEYIIIQPDGTLASSIPGRPVPSNLKGNNCDPTTIKAGAAAGGYTLTDAQANVFACLSGGLKGMKGGSESNCTKTGTNYMNPNNSLTSIYSAYGAFQIVLGLHSNCFENQACYSAVGISGNLNCKGNRARCQRAADNLACSSAAAACILITKGRGNFRDWTTDYTLPNGRFESHAAQRACAIRFGQPH